MDNAEKINEIVRNKAKELVARLKASIHSFNMKHVASDDNPDPLDKITSRVSTKYGLANRIRVKFKRSGVFRHKGVGRGTKASQAGTTTRRPAEWFNPVMEQVADELADEAADQMADIVINNITIR